MSLNNQAIRQEFASYGGALLILALVFTCKTTSYAIGDDTLLSHIIEQIEQDWLSPALWGVGAVIMWAAFISRNKRFAAVAFGVAATILILWGALTMWTGLADFLGRGVVYLGLFATSLWGVARTQIPLREMKAERRRDPYGEYGGK